jgi:hypothetical protein
MPAKSSAPKETPDDDERPVKKKRFALPMITIVSVIAVGVVGLFKLPQWRERWAFDRIRNQNGHVELKGERGRKYVDVDLTNVEEESSDLESLNSFYPVERLVVSPKTNDAALERMTRLLGMRHLSLVESAVTDHGVAMLEKLPQLTELSLARTQVSESGLESLSKLTKLTRLDLSGLAIHGPGLVALKDLKELQEVRLSDTQLDDTGLTALGSLPGLRRLRLARTRITDAGLAGIKDLKKLESLDLEGTQVGDKGLEQIKDLTRLTELVLNDTKISDAGLEHLAGMSALDTLRVENTRVTKDKVDAFMQTRQILRMEITGLFKKEGEFPDPIYFGYTGQTKEGEPFRGGIEAIAASGVENKVEEETAPSVISTIEWKKNSGKYTHYRLPLGDYIVYARCGDFYDMRFLTLDGTTGFLRRDFILNRGATAIIEVKLPPDSKDQIVTLFELKRDPKNPDKTNENFPCAMGVEIETENGAAKFRIPAGTYKIGHAGQVKQISARGKEVLPVEF